MSAAQKEEISLQVWSRARRIWASVAIVCWVGIVFAGPMTVPISTPDLTEPLRKTLKPVHQSLYIGHGYRFFAPNPGPSRIIKYEIGMPDQTIAKGVFPDRDSHWPRLLYHRWFMLSETVYNELNSTLDNESFKQTQELMDQQIRQLRSAGQGALADKLKGERAAAEKNHFASLKRIELLTNAIGQHLIREHGGEWIKLSLHERTIPLPGQVILGEKLGAPEGLSPALKSWVIESKESDSSADSGVVNE